MLRLNFDFEEVVDDALLSLAMKGADDDSEIESAKNMAAAYRRYSRRIQAAQLELAWLRQSATADSNDELCHCGFLAIHIGSSDAVQPKCTGTAHLVVSTLTEEHVTARRCLQAWCAFACERRCGDIVHALQRIIKPDYQQGPSSSAFSTEMLAQLTIFNTWKRSVRADKDCGDESSHSNKGGALSRFDRGSHTEIGGSDLLDALTLATNDERHVKFHHIRSKLKRESTYLTPQQKAAIKLSSGKSSITHMDRAENLEKASGADTLSTHDSISDRQNRRRKLRRKFTRQGAKSAPLRQVPKQGKSASHHVTRPTRVTVRSDGAPTARLSELLVEQVSPEALMALLRTWAVNRNFLETDSRPKSVDVAQLPSLAYVSARLGDVANRSELGDDGVGPPFECPRAPRSAPTTTMPSAPFMDSIRSQSPRSLFSANSPRSLVSTTSRRPRTVPAAPIPFIKIAKDWVPPTEPRTVLKQPFLRERLLFDRKVSQLEKQQRSRHESRRLTHDHRSATLEPVFELVE